MIEDADIEFEKLENIVSKTEYLIKYSNWFFQMIIPKLPVTNIPNFNFE